MSVLVDAQSSSEIPEGLMNNPVYFLYKAIKVIHPQMSIVSHVSIIFCTPLLVVKRNFRGYLG